MDEDVERLYGLCDLITPMAIRVAATLRLADRIATGTSTLTELAAAVDADPDALGRLLRYLAARGVFAEPEPGRFALTDLAQPLCDDHPDQARSWLDLTGAIGRADLAFVALLDVVHTGKPGHAMVHGRDFWADLASNPDLTASFDMLMAANKAWSAPWLATQDWNDTATVAILRRCAQAAGLGGRVLLGELVASGAQDRQTYTHMDLRMLVYLGGRERTLDDLTALADAAGLTITSVTPAEYGNSVIDCTVRHGSDLSG